MIFSKQPGKGRGHKSLDLRNADVGDAYMKMQQACLDGVKENMTPSQLARKIEKLQPSGSSQHLRDAWAVAKKEIFAEYELPHAAAKPRNS